MLALGRILQVIGWLWVAVGFFGSVVNLPDVSPFPGIILLFIARVFRKQAGQSSPSSGDDDQKEHEEVDEEPEIPRMLDTELRYRSASKSGGDALGLPPVEVEPQSARTPSAKASGEAKKEPEQRSDLLERVLLAGEEAVDDKTPQPEYPDDLEIDTGRTLTSAEMIARAHRRWDRKA